MSNKRKIFWGNNPRFKKQKPVTSTSNNRYQSLSDLDCDDDDDSVCSIGGIQEKEKVPPITVDKLHRFTDIIKLLGLNCKYKRMSIGTKIIPDSLAVYEDAIKKLQREEMKFFTHPVIDPKKFKLVLFGLPKMDVMEIQDELKTNFNIVPLNVKEILTTRSSADDAIYMVEFSRKQVSKKVIRKIKFICKVQVHWQNPLRRAKGPTICSKCSMHGHGSAHCYRVSVCLSCGGAHDYANCQVNKSSNSGPVVHKCFNCVQNNLKNFKHRADDPKCPSRQKYLEIRRKATQKRVGPKQIKNVRNTVVLSEEEDCFETASATRGKTHFPTYNDNQKISYAKMTKVNALIDDCDDIPNEKIIEIYFEALDALQKCKNKYDKMRVLGMMLKHVI